MNATKRLLLISQAIALMGGVLLAISGADSAAPQLQMKPAVETTFYNGVNFIIDRFRVNEVIAIGEAHRHQEVHDFIHRLVTDPRFADRVDDVVVEFGSAAHQDIIDRFTQGRPVGNDELRLVWRDTIDILLWDAPIYERFFRTIRAINQRRSNRRLRVLLAGVPVAWRLVTASDWKQLDTQRDRFAADLIEHEVVSKSRRALLIFAARHVTRDTAYDVYRTSPRNQPSVAELIALRHPRTAFLVLANPVYWSVRDLDLRLGTWASGFIFPLHNTWLGSETTGPSKQSPRLVDLADALLTFGPTSRSRTSIPAPDLYSDGAYLRELIRRDRIQGGVNATELEALRERFRK